LAPAQPPRTHPWLQCRGSRRTDQTEIETGGHRGCAPPARYHQHGVKLLEAAYNSWTAEGCGAGLGNPRSRALFDCNPRSDAVTESTAALPLSDECEAKLGTKPGRSVVAALFPFRGFL